VPDLPDLPADAADEYTKEWIRDMRALMTMHEDCVPPSPPVVLTNGDLSANNILADGDTVTGITDWETAAWMPTCRE
jgi:aminoglycoside phosphotransferase (APT) family kinase protein